METYLNALQELNEESLKLRNTISGLELNISEAQARILYALNNKSGIRAKDLGSASITLGPSISRMLRSLENQGLVSTDHDDADFRCLIINITKEGRRTINQILSKLK